LGKQQLFTYLKERGAQLGLSNKEGKDLLHIAIEVDQTGHFIQEVIDAGVDVNKTTHYYTPIDRAIRCNNRLAIKMLLRNGALLSDCNLHKLLNDPSVMNSCYANICA
jgi:ankyrin repeat protein